MLERWNEVIGLGQGSALGLGIDWVFVHMIRLQHTILMHCTFSDYTGSLCVLHIKSF